MFYSLLALILMFYPLLELWWGSAPHLSCADFVALFCVFCALTVQRRLDYMVKSYEESLKLAKGSVEHWKRRFDLANERANDSLRLAASMSGRIIRPGALDAEHTWVLVKKRYRNGNPSCLGGPGKTCCPFYSPDYQACSALHTEEDDCQGTPLEGCPVHNNKQTQMGL